MRHLLNVLVGRTGRWSAGECDEVELPQVPSALGHAHREPGPPAQHVLLYQSLRAGRTTAPFERHPPTPLRLPPPSPPHSCRQLTVSRTKSAPVAEPWLWTRVTCMGGHTFTTHRECWERENDRAADVKLRTKKGAMSDRQASKVGKNQLSRTSSASGRDTGRDAPFWRRQV